MKRATISVPRMACATALVGMLTSGCGAWQAVKDTSSEATRTLLVAKVKQMHLLIGAPAELNRDRNGASLPVALRVYQLKDARAFSAATYAQLLNDSGKQLKADTLSYMDVVVGPQARVTLSSPMADATQYVGIAAFFRDVSKADWQLVIPRSQWKQTDPVKVSVAGNRLALER